MARKVTQKSLKHDEFVEAAFDIEQWIEEHWRQVAAVAGGIVAVALIGWGWYVWHGRSVAKTELLLAEGLSKVRGDAQTAESPAGDAATRYTAALPSFEQAARRGGNTPPGRVAAFYQATSLAKLGRATEAIVILEPLAATGEDDVFADLVRAKLAWVYLETGQPDKAVAAWKELAARPETSYPADAALLHAAEILDGAGRGEEAKAVLQDLIARYPQGAAARDAAKLLAKVSGAVAPAATAAEAP